MASLAERILAALPQTQCTRCGYPDCARYASAIALDQGPRRKRSARGYAGWAPGQLEDELEENAWLTVAADEHILFAVPHHKKLSAAFSKLGISPSQLAPYSGHA